MRLATPRIGTVVAISRIFVRTTVRAGLHGQPRPTPQSVCASRDKGETVAAVLIARLVRATPGPANWPG